MINDSIVALADSGSIIPSPGPGRRVVIRSLFLFAQTEVGVRLHSGSADLIGTAAIPILLAAQGGFVLPFSEYGWRRGEEDEGVTLTMSAPANVTGCVVWSVDSV